MAHKKKTTKTPFPDKEQILEFIRDNPDHVGKREIARAFHLKGDDRIRLKILLREMQEDGMIDRGRGRRFAEPGTLPEVTVVVVTGTDSDGEVLAKPQNWDADELGKPPVIYVAPQRHGQQALGEGDRALMRLKQLDEHSYEGKVIRVIAAAPPRVLGILTFDDEGRARIRPTDKRHRAELMVAREDTGEARNGDLVRAEIKPGHRLGLRWGKVVENLHEPGAARSVSLIAIHEHDIPTEFSDEALQEAEAMGAAPLDDREDLRDMDLVTIDGADARDFDDAVWAEADTDPNNPDGWHLVVAIADVSWYVREGMALDEDAYKRGNSVYFPDRCVPMLPEVLSNGWCSLVPDEDRPCLAAHLWIDGEGNLLRHRFTRALMRSKARLTYSQVQTARDGAPDETAAPLMDGVITPLYEAFDVLEAARKRRGALEIDMPERRVILDDEGNVEKIEQRVRYDSHRLIEEFMILANVAAAQTLEKRHQPCMYRVHDSPTLDKLEALREFLESLDISLPKGQVRKPGQFNGILERVKDTPYAHMVNEVVLRSQCQAVYAPDNLGHFGLALERYCHFTSPIRRYADLLVHRALVRGLKLGEGGLGKDHPEFEEMGEHISATERTAAAAERDAVARYVAAYLVDRVGAAFPGRISGVTRFGLFVTLDEIGGDGLVPIKTLPDDYYIHDETRHTLTGRRNGLTFRLGEPIKVVLEEADPVTGGMILSLEEGGGPAPWLDWTGDRKTRRKQGAKDRKAAKKTGARKGGRKKTPAKRKG